MSSPNPFAEALSQHQMADLRAAFDACMRESGTTYDRTTLNRWVDGSVPPNGDFVRLFADVVGDPAIYDGWEEARGARSPSKVRTVVSRFDNLSVEEKDEAFHLIRGDYLSTFPNKRERMAYRIEISDPPGGDDDHLIANVQLTWIGAISAGANVQFVPDQESLGDAYGQSECVFREILDFEPDRRDELLASGRGQILAINPLDSQDPKGAHHVGELIEPGVFRFDNNEATAAQIRLSVSYPMARGRPIFLLRIGQYQVDTFDVTLTLNGANASAPQAFPYLPPGRQREWSQSYFPPNELFVTVGTGNTQYGEGDGVVLSWSEA